MTPLRIVIVDDEPLARAVVREYAGADPGARDRRRMRQRLRGGEGGRRAASRTSSCSTCRCRSSTASKCWSCSARDQTVIFITAYDQYALRAFDVHAVDYLLKPFSAERFQEAMARVRERLQAQPRRRRTSPRWSATRKPRTGPAERVLIRDGANVHVLPVDAIDYVEAQDDYVAFKSAGKQYLKDQTLAAVEATLDPSRFVRIHRSYLLNIDRIAKVELYAKDSRIAILRDGTRLPVSRAGYARLSELL